jgi:hypothetical protein
MCAEKKDWHYQMNWLNVLQKNQDETCEKLCLCVKLVEYNSKYSVACLFNELSNADQD